MFEQARYLNHFQEFTLMTLGLHDSQKVREGASAAMPFDGKALPYGRVAIQSRKEGKAPARTTCR